jgi:hypothetical protein
MATKSNPIIPDCTQSQNPGRAQSPPVGALKSVLEKALDEVSRGNPEEGERLIELALLKDADTANLVSALTVSLRDILSRFCSCIAQGNGEIEGDREAIAHADSLLTKVGGTVLSPQSESDELVQFNEARCRHAFDRAIAAGILSADEDADNAAANYMFMGELEEGDAFKHIATRGYVYHKPGATS